MKNSDTIPKQISDLLGDFEQYLDVTVDRSQDDRILSSITINAPVKRTRHGDTLSITDTVAELLIGLCSVWEQDQPFLVHIKTTQGTGKTTGTMETAAVQLEPIAAFGPRHTDIEADAEKLQAWKGVHFIGKDKGCINSDYEGKHASVQPEISSRWCDNCEKKSECPVFDPYRELRTGMTNLTGAHEHLLHLPQVLSQQENNLWSQINAVLIDESPWDAIVENTITVELADINNTIDSIKDIRESSDVSYDELLDQLQIALEALKRELRRDRIRDSLDELADRPEYDYTSSQCRDLIDPIKQAGAIAQGRSIESYIDALNRSHQFEYDPDFLKELSADLTAVDSEIRKQDHDQTPFELLREACERARETDGLLDELAERQADHLEQGISYQDVFCILAPKFPEIIESWEKAINEGRTLSKDTPPEELWRTIDGQLEITYLRDCLAIIAKSKPTFVLATELPTEKLVSAVDIPVIVIEDTSAPEMEAYHLDSKNLGVTALRGSSRALESLLELTELAVRREAAEGNTTFIAAKQEFVDQITDHLVQSGYVGDTDFKIGYYYNLTGSNRFEDCDAVVLFGSPRWPDMHILSTQVLTGISRETLHYEGQAGELRDGVHRIRPLRNPSRLYSLTAALDLGDVLTDTSTTFAKGVPELRQRLKKEARDAEKRHTLRNEIVAHLSSCEKNPTKTELVNALTASRDLDSVLDELEANGDIESVQVSNGKPGRDPITYRLLRPST